VFALLTEHEYPAAGDAVRDSRFPGLALVFFAIWRLAVLADGLDQLKGTQAVESLVFVGMNMVAAQATVVFIGLAHEAQEREISEGERRNDHGASP
jgi:hypothetical protein